MSDTGLKVTDIYLIGTIEMSHPELKGTLNNATARIKRNIKQCQTLV
jgi:hypothetical protein